MVLLPVYDDSRNGLSILGIIRSAGGHHGGQFAFAGGGVEDGDAGPWDTALREFHEELGLDLPVERLGILGQFNTVVSAYRVLVAVAFLPFAPQGFQLQEEEVAAVLGLPICGLRALAEPAGEAISSWELPIAWGFDLDPEEYLLAGCVPTRGSGHRIQRQGQSLDMPFIWGLSARILWDLLRLWPGSSPLAGDCLGSPPSDIRKPKSGTPTANENNDAFDSND